MDCQYAKFSPLFLKIFLSMLIIADMYTYGITDTHTNITTYKHALFLYYYVFMKAYTVNTVI